MAEDSKEQDRYLPIANIGRIMKDSLPKSAKIAKDSKEAVQESVSEFISFLTSEYFILINRACEHCLNDKRKTINGDDILFAIHSLGFESYFECLELYLKKYRFDYESTSSSNKAIADHYSKDEGEN